MAGAKTPKSDGHKHPWIARPGEYDDVPKKPQTAAQKKANAEFNEFFGLTDKKKPAAKKPAPKKPKK